MRWCICCKNKLVLVACSLPHCCWWRCREANSLCILGSCQGWLQETLPRRKGKLDCCTWSWQWIWVRREKKNQPHLPVALKIVVSSRRWKNKFNCAFCGMHSSPHLVLCGLWKMACVCPGEFMQSKVEGAYGLLCWASWGDGQDCKD